MKNEKTHIILVIFVLVVIAFVIFVVIPKITKSTINEFNYDPEKAENLGGISITYLEDCQGWAPDLPLEERGKYQYCAYSISEANLSKLKSIENLKGNKICVFDKRKQNNTCGFEDFYDNDSRDIWSLTWYEIVVRRGRRSIEIWENSGSYFYLYSSSSAAGVPPQGYIYLLDPFDKKIIEELKK
jgi:hypothetical protein